MGPVFQLANEWREPTSGDRGQGAQPGHDEPSQWGRDRESTERDEVWQGCGQRRDTSGGMEMSGTVGSDDTCKLFNIIMTTECIPSAWRNSILVPIFKERVTFKSVRITEASNCSHTPSKYGRRWSTEGWESARKFMKANLDLCQEEASRKRYSSLSRH